MRFPSATLTRDIRRDPPPSLHTTAAGPQLPNSSFSAPEKALKIQHHFFLLKIAKSTKMEPECDLLWRPKSSKIYKKYNPACISKKQLQQVCENATNMDAQVP